MLRSVILYPVRKRSVILLLLVALLMLTSFNKKRDSQLRFSQMPPGLVLTDSILFKANEAAGWNLIGAYFTLAADSVTAELTVTRNLTSSQDWNSVSMAGTIGPEYLPGSEQVAEFAEPNRIWRAIIKPDGTLFIKLISGLRPPGNIIALPVKIKYKK